MPKTRPQGRIAYTEKQLVRLQEDVQDAWRGEHDEVKTDCWVWEDLFGRAVNLYDGIVSLESAFQRDTVELGVDDRPELDADLAALYAEWVKHAEGLLPHEQRLAAIYGPVDNGDLLRDRLEDARAAVACREVGETLLAPEQMAELAKGNPNPERYGD